MNAKRMFYRGLPCKVLRVDEKWNWPKTMMEIEYQDRGGRKRILMVDARKVSSK